MPLTLVLSCDIRLDPEKGPAEEFVMSINDFPDIIPPPNSQICAKIQHGSGNPKWTSVDLAVSHLTCAIRHFTKIKPLRTYLNLEASIHEPLTWWTIPLIKEAFRNEGWRILSKEEAAREFPFFHFS